MDTKRGASQEAPLSARETRHTYLMSLRLIVAVNASISK